MIAETPLVHELQSLRKEWWCFLLLGISMVVLGVIALGSSFIASLAVMLTFGALLFLGGMIQIVSSVWAGKWSGFLLHVMIGILYAVIGYLLMDAPVRMAMAMTLVIAAFLLVSGVFRIVASLALRFHEWGWVLLNGVVSVMLGILIYKHWPASGLWTIGLFVGIEMLFNGWAWIMLAINLRHIPVVPVAKVQA
jgi:uncharacterized membrane protein HdeD (DUF308 family)